MEDIGVIVVLIIFNVNGFCLVTVLVDSTFTKASLPKQDVLLMKNVSE